MCSMKSFLVSVAMVSKYEAEESEVGKTSFLCVNGENKTERKD